MFFVAPGQVHEYVGRTFHGVIIAFGPGFTRELTDASGDAIEKRLFRHFTAAPFDPAYFTRFFGRMTGMSPSEFRSARWS